jgi:hypothetical protein
MFVTNGEALHQAIPHSNHSIERGIGSMKSLSTTADPFNLEGLAARVRSSSNFWFNWQFYDFDGIDPRSPVDIRAALSRIIAEPGLHQFLRDSIDDKSDRAFEIDSLHEHCRVELTADFENILAAAAADHLGAYSRDMRPATAGECAEVAKLFGSAGEYVAFQLLPGKIADCPVCRTHNNHLFTTWFEGVAWDWCLLATWPDRHLLWLGCLTDTD